jgi:hypothetical protein
MTTEFETEASANIKQRTEMVHDVVESLVQIIIHDTNNAKGQEASGQTEAAEQTLWKVARIRSELRKVLQHNRDVYVPGPDIIAIAFPDATAGDDSSRSRATGLPGAIIVSALILAGALLLSVALATGANWFYAEMLFVLVAYLVWQRWL